MNVIKHKFQSVKPDGADTTRVRPSNWNDEHLFSGGADGDSLVRDSGQSDGANWDARERVLSSQFTDVGNVGAGEDDLMTYVLAASVLNANGRAIRIRLWGRTTNNANAKTLQVYFGSQIIMTQALTVSIAGTWRVDVTIQRTGLNTQRIFAELLQLATILHKQTATAGTQTETGTITIKATAQGTTDNDIVQEGLLVELLNK